MKYIQFLCFIICMILSGYSQAISQEKDQAATIFCNLIEKSSVERAHLFLSLIERYYSLSLPYDTSLQQHEILNKIITTIVSNDVSIIHDKLNESLLKLLIIIMTYDTKDEFFESEKAVEKCVNRLITLVHTTKSSPEEATELHTYCTNYFATLLDPVRLGLSSVVLQQQVETFIKTSTEEIIKSLAFSSEYTELSKHYIMESVRRTIKELLLSKAPLTIDTQLYHLINNNIIPLRPKDTTLQAVSKEAYQKFEQALQTRLDNNISVTDILLDSALFAEKLIMEALAHHTQ